MRGSEAETDFRGFGGDQAEQVGELGAFGFSEFVEFVEAFAVEVRRCDGRCAGYVTVAVDILAQKCNVLRLTKCLL